MMEHSFTKAMYSRLYHVDYNDNDYYDNDYYMMITVQTST